MPPLITSDVIILLVFPLVLFICVVLVLILLTQLYWIIIQHQPMIAKPNIFTARQIEDNGRQEENAVVVRNTLLIRGLYQYRLVPSEINFLLNQQKMNMIYISSLAYHNESQTVVTENVRYMVEPIQETQEYSSNSTTIIGIR